MPKVPTTGVPGLHVDTYIPRYYVRITRDGISHFGGYFPLTETGFRIARSVANDLSRKYPRTDRKKVSL